MFLDYAAEQFEEQIKDTYQEGHQDIIENKDIMNFLHEWSEFVANTINSIYEEKFHFWDEAVLENDTGIVFDFIAALLYCQVPRNTGEEFEIKHIFSELIDWISKDFKWGKTIREDLYQLFEEYIDIMNSPGNI